MMHGHTSMKLENLIGKKMGVTQKRRLLQTETQDQISLYPIQLQNAQYVLHVLPYTLQDDGRIHDKSSCNKHRP